MDPAEPSFEHHPTITRLDAADAQFVDIIHSNGAPITQGGAGLMQVSGHVDFYPNGGKSQPGCPSLVQGVFHNLVNGDFSGNDIFGYLCYIVVISSGLILTVYCNSWLIII